MNRQKQDPHKFKCESIEDVFKEHSDTTVHHLRLPKRSNEDDFFQYWDDALQNKTENDLVIIYFHGSASGCEEEYKWYIAVLHNSDVC